MEPIAPGPPSAEVGPQTVNKLTPIEQLSLRSTEKQPGLIEAVPQGGAANVTLPTLPSPKQPLIAPSVKQADSPITTTAPLAANDDDVMEREWVQKAKKIVSETKEDPYIQEKEVSKLQADYIKKRYGKEIKIINEHA